MPGVKEFIQILLITPEAKPYAQHNKMLINIQSKKQYVWYDVCMIYTSSQGKKIATQTMAIYGGPCGGTICTLPIY